MATRSRSRSRERKGARAGRGASQSGSGKSTGTCKRWAIRGFGFITPDDGGDDIFCHANEITDGRCLRQGGKCEYVKVWDDKRNKWRAEQVTGGSPEPGPPGYGVGYGQASGEAELTQAREGRNSGSGYYTQSGQGMTGSAHSYIGPSAAPAAPEYVQQRHPAPAAPEYIQLVSITVPAGCVPGQSIPIMTPAGQQMLVSIPMGVGPGQSFQVQVPAPPPVAQIAPVMAVPVPGGYTQVGSSRAYSASTPGTSAAEAGAMPRATPGMAGVGAAWGSVPSGGAHAATQRSQQFSTQYYAQ